MKYITILLSILIVKGCAGFSKPEMKSEEYDYYSSVMSLTEICLDLGRISPQLMSEVKTNLDVIFQLKNIDQDQLMQSYDRKIQHLSRVSNVDCVRGEVLMHDVIANGQQIRKNSSNNSAPNNNTQRTPRTVYCNQIGFSTICTEY